MEKQMLQTRGVLFGLVFTIFGALIIVDGIKAIFSPIPNLPLAPLLLLISGSLFVTLGFYMPRVFKK